MAELTGLLKSIPRGALPLAADAVSFELMSGRDVSTWLDSDEALARAALKAALPVIEKAALRAAARHILLLDDFESNRLCPACWGPTTRRPANHLDPDPFYRCGDGHEWKAHPVQGPYTDTRTVLRKLSRGEPLPDLPAKENDDA
jgi:hypothetical protein